MSYLESLKYNVVNNEVNLRTHRTCGGILQIQLLQLPPQPKQIRNEILLTMCEFDISDFFNIRIRHFIKLLMNFLMLSHSVWTVLIFSKMQACPFHPSATQYTF